MAHPAPSCRVAAYATAPQPSPSTLFAFFVPRGSHDGITVVRPRCESPTTAPPGSRDAYSTIQAESYNQQSGIMLETTSDIGGGRNITSFGH